MNIFPTRYALVRDRTHWDASMMSAVVADVNGALTLLPIPRPDALMAYPSPYETESSGLACASCYSLFISVTAHHQIAYDDGVCGQAARLPTVPRADSALGSFDTPRGIAFRPGRGLYVADSHNARIVLLRDPSLQVAAVISAGLTQPIAVALDSVGRITTIDGGDGRLVRFSPVGVPDTVYDATVAADGIVAAFIAIAIDDTLYVSSTSGELRRFDADGMVRPWSGLDAGIRSGALAAAGGHLYVADIKSGRILVLDRDSGATLAMVPDYRGPVAALTMCENGDLFVKPGSDDRVTRCRAANAYAAIGRIEAGPLDAGEKDVWYQVGVDAEAPPHTGVTLGLYLNDDATRAPGISDWVTVPAPTALITSPQDEDGKPIFPKSGRYLWVRVTLESVNAAVSPRLDQIRAETAGEDYFDQLPAMYRRDDRSGFVAKLLSLLRAQFDTSERVIDSLPARIAIDFAEVGDLPWLASWLGFALPAGMTPDAERALLRRIVTALYARRGTAAGLAELVHLHTGVRPRIVEAFRERRVWQLGVDSVLGFDTALAPADAVGMMVPDTTVLRTAEAPYDCAEPERLTVGTVVVGGSGLLSREMFGAPLFDDSAHRFRVAVPAYQAPTALLRDVIREVIEQEKPAHTDYALCFIEPTMRVGIQAQLGIDTIVAGPPAARSLAGMTLDLDAYLDGSDGTGRVGSQSQLGRNTVLG